MAQNNLGNVLQSLGALPAMRRVCSEAVIAYRLAALEKFIRERAPLDWAATRNNLGNVLDAPGRSRWRYAAAATGCSCGISRSARGAHPRAQRRCSGRPAPAHLGNVLPTRLGDLAGVMVRYCERGSSPIGPALEEFTREHAPPDWATTQHSLGNVLQSLGDLDRTMARCWAKRSSPIAWRSRNAPANARRCQWAMTQNNLGNALTTLGEREGSTARLEQAVVAFRQRS